MATFNQKHPQMAAKVADLIERGLTPDQIIQDFIDSDVKKDLEYEEGSGDDEVFSDEVLIISQALAYREATKDDLAEIFLLFSKAYSPEVNGTESFRSGEVMSKDSIVQLLSDSTFHWLLIEAPSGKGVEVDGLILGAACYSTDGVSRRNGEIEGNLGSIRLFAILPRYHGFCLGQRLLSKVELEMARYGCCKSMACVPSPRSSVADWISRRGYFDLGEVSYPADSIGHTLVKDATLVRFVKDFKEDPPRLGDYSAKIKQRVATGKKKASTEVKSIIETSANRDEVFIPDID